MSSNAVLWATVSQSLSTINLRESSILQSRTYSNILDLHDQAVRLKYQMLAYSVTFHEHVMYASIWRFLEAFYDIPPAPHFTYQRRTWTPDLDLQHFHHATTLAFRCA